MYAVINNKGIVAKDFRTKPEAQSWIKKYDLPLRIVPQDSAEFIKLERKK